MLPVQPRICARCRWHVPGYIERMGIGFCTWREENNRPKQPSMNIGSVYRLSEDGRVLTVRWDASCQQFKAKDS